MPASVAAFLCLGFVAWLLFLGQKGLEGVSRSLWLPTLWVAIIASRPVGCWFSDDDASVDPNAYLDGSPIDRNVFLLLIFLGIIVLARRRLDWKMVAGMNGWLWLFYGYMTFSVVWSEHPYIASKRLVKDLGNIVMILIIVSEQDPVEATRQVLLRCAYMLIPFSVLVIKYFLEIGRYYNRWTWQAYFCGVTTDKNALGRLAMLSALALLWSVLHRRPAASWRVGIRQAVPDLLVLSICFWLLAVADSATALGCALLGGAVLLATESGWVKRNSRLVPAAAVGIVTLSLVCLFVPGLRGQVTSTLGRSADLTERMDIWDGALKLGTNPLIGEGFGSIWLTRRGRQLLEDLQAGHGHNGYLETYLNGGIIGLGLLLAALAYGGRRIVKDISAGADAGSLCSTLFVSCFIYNYTEAALNNNSVAGFTLFLSVLWQPLAARAIRSSQADGWADQLTLRGSKAVTHC